MMAEGGLKETIIFLGWFINTRLFTIALQTEKVPAWFAGIRDITKRRKGIKHKELHRLIDKLNHVCFIIPDAKHFMNNLRRMEYLVRFKKKVKLSRDAMDDLEL